MAEKEIHNFQAETKELLDLMIHSVYSNKEIFLRELISNASDAIDKLKFEAIGRPELLPAGEELCIELETDAQKRTLTIRDNGIGMSRQEVISHIGTIAKSGTREFLHKIRQSENKDRSGELIGQFGVGFYSAFMVANKVELKTRRADGEETTYWSSTGNGSYEIYTEEGGRRGTEITLYLKEVDPENGIEDYTNTWVLERIIKKYSDFISYPIKVKVKENEKDESQFKWKTVNSMKPLWQRAKSEVKEEDYREFYKHISHDWNDPLKYLLYKAEGRIEYTALLYIPKKAPWDFYYQSYRSGLQLYVKKVLISEALEDLLPRYLRFVKGVVESADLPLNISREMLQQDRHIVAIRKGLTNKLLSFFQEMLNKERELYYDFYREFGNALKEGVNSDFENKDKLQNLLLFPSSNSEKGLTTLKEYVERMHPEQKEIYYILGESRQLLENSPHTEAVRQKGYEILYLTEPVDELILQAIGEYEGKKLKALGKGELVLDEKEKEKKESQLKKAEKDYEELLIWLKEHLKDYVRDVKLSQNLISAPACLMAEELDFSPHLEKILKRQGERFEKTKKILEINPNHELIKGFAGSLKGRDKEILKELATLLLGYAFLTEGAELPDPVAFNKALVNLMARQLQAKVA
ncbi:MAG: molecular chaperone HtpG [Leptospiraceae bacterium]|nr:molecular chaperone HtpG [Leptospiraceae bacterium]MDW8305983.1 molecular chaperone HtpG [Leptospiraceae bacterium]